MPKAPPRFVHKNSAAKIAWMMPERNDLAKQITTLVDQRVALETKLQNEPGEISESRARQYGDEYSALQRKLAGAVQADVATRRSASR